MAGRRTPRLSAGLLLAKPFGMLTADKAREIGHREVALRRILIAASRRLVRLRARRVPPRIPAVQPCRPRLRVRAECRRPARVVRGAMLDVEAARGVGELHHHHHADALRLQVLDRGREPQLDRDGPPRATRHLSARIM